ncbi:MAG: hypothetical protein NZ902_05405 [Acidilobaceae archaeon]|nr:hypothetical protein [Acidilobaceae archaeon]MCX8166002.1 hypothetical protein [Acidilobaceae archaeon]
MAKVEVLKFKRDRIKAGDVELHVYRLISRTDEEWDGELADLLNNILKKESEADYVVVEQHGEVERVQGEVPAGKKEQDTMILHPRIARLRRVAVIRQKDLQQELGYYKVNLESVKWTSVESGVYVFDGKVRAPPDVIMLVLETDDGIQHVTLGS